MHAIVYNGSKEKEKKIQALQMIWIRCAIISVSRSSGLAIVPVTTAKISSSKVSLAAVVQSSLPAASPPSPRSSSGEREEEEVSVIVHSLGGKLCHH